MIFNKKNFLSKKIALSFFKDAPSLMNDVLSIVAQYKVKILIYIDLNENENCYFFRSFSNPELNKRIFPLSDDDDPTIIIVLKNNIPPQNINEWIVLAIYIVHELGHYNNCYLGKWNHQMMSVHEKIDKFQSGNKICRINKAEEKKFLREEEMAWLFTKKTLTIYNLLSIVKDLEKRSLKTYKSFTKNNLK